MGTYSQYRTDTSSETKGIELDYGDAGIFLMARAGGSNKAFTRLFEKKMRPHRRALNSGNLPESAARKVGIDVMVETTLLGWSGVTGPDGKELKYSKENARKLLTDLPDLYLQLQQDSANASLYLQDIKEAEAKN